MVGKMPEECRPVKVMTFGAFDVLHKGHGSLFIQAKNFGGNYSDLLVVVASDARIRQVKGEKPWFSQKKRMENVKATGLADFVIRGDKENTLQPIIRHKPDIIVLGYDQPLREEVLGKMLAKLGLKPKIFRAGGFDPHIYKSSKLKRLQEEERMSMMLLGGANDYEPNKSDRAKRGH